MLLSSWRSRRRRSGKAVKAALAALASPLGDAADTDATLAAASPAGRAGVGNVNSGLTEHLLAASPPRTPNAASPAPLQARATPVTFIFDRGQPLGDVPMMETQLVHTTEQSAETSGHE